MASHQTQLILVLVAVLLAVVLASAAVLWLLPAGEAIPPADLTDQTMPGPAEVPPAPAASGGFNTAVLRSSRYTTLDQQLVTDGSLPVQPPASIGKANPFL